MAFRTQANSARQMAQAGGHATHWRPQLVPAHDAARKGFGLAARERKQRESSSAISAHRGGLALSESCLQGTALALTVIGRNRPVEQHYKHFPINLPDPVEAIKFSMDQRPAI